MWLVSCIVQSRHKPNCCWIKWWCNIYMEYQWSIGRHAQGKLVSAPILYWYIVYVVCVAELSMLCVFVCMWLPDIVAFIQFRFSLWSFANHARKLGAMYLTEMVYFRLFSSIEAKMSIHFVFFVKIEKHQITNKIWSHIDLRCTEKRNQNTKR